MNGIDLVKLYGILKQDITVGQVEVAIGDGNIDGEPPFVTISFEGRVRDGRYALRQKYDGMALYHLMQRGGEERIAEEFASRWRCEYEAAIQQGRGHSVLPI